MSFAFEELDFQQTALGDIYLRRRAEPRLDGKVLYEVKLNDEFLMSSLFVEAEIQLAKLGLAKFDNAELDIVIGGLGLGYTAAAVLDNTSVRSLRVIEVMQAVIAWHQKGLVPLGKQLTSDQRCKFIHDDFFHLAKSAISSFDATKPTQRVHAVLLDIDHSPKQWLHPANSTFYTQKSLTRLALKLHPAGLFGLWSNDPPDDQFTALLKEVFHTAQYHIIAFDNPYTGKQSTNTVYLARTKRA